ncbi:hypothetical protein Ahy_B10g105198 isoform B [Arachis hypogaea]|uniref:PB1-like domain-containing protein n=1 Tax=Arachis hypogaea TaxID=3818 RepID=A0A444X7H9_ARAHY|nr:hypothetical protein Ahy_B10g105198 isoform B [Arachis hypogaea]
MVLVGKVDDDDDDIMSLECDIVPWMMMDQDHHRQCLGLSLRGQNHTILYCLCRLKHISQEILLCPSRDSSWLHAQIGEDDRSTPNRSPPTHNTLIVHRLARRASYQAFPRGEQRRHSLSFVKNRGMIIIHITMSINHRGHFERGPRGKVSYIGGEVIEIERVNVDTLNGFFISDLLKDIGYTSIADFYWLELGKELDDGLRLLRADMDIVKMSEAIVRNGNKINVYTELPVDQPMLVEEKNVTP